MNRANIACRVLCSPCELHFHLRNAHKIHDSSLHLIACINPARKALSSSYICWSSCRAVPAVTAISPKYALAPTPVHQSNIASQIGRKSLAMKRTLRWFCRRVSQQLPSGKSFYIEWPVQKYPAFPCALSTMSRSIWPMTNTLVENLTNFELPRFRDVCGVYIVHLNQK